MGESVIMRLMKRLINIYREWKHHIKKLLCFIISLSFLVFISHCEDPDVFYRPDLPEKLCSIGIVDLDDTTLRHISFEKSFQSEYNNELKDSLRDFSFSISSIDGEIFYFCTDSTVKEIKDFIIPDSIIFHPGQKYYLKARERDVEEISAEVFATASPAEPKLISTEVLNTTLPEPAGCLEILNVGTVKIKFSFEKNESIDYAILLKGWGFSLTSSWVGWPGFLDFTVVDGNTPGFLSPLHGLATFHNPCNNPNNYSHPTFAYFVQGEKITGSECQLTVSVQYRDGLSLFDIFKAIDIKVISIPRELYLFEKTLYTYSKISTDPFSEPVYLNGNIKGGNGIFALCRSRELKIIFSPLI
jgi:hypothetical protein